MGGKKTDEVDPEQQKEEEARRKLEEAEALAAAQAGIANTVFTLLQNNIVVNYVIFYNTYFIVHSQLTNLLFTWNIHVRMKQHVMKNPSFT